MRSHLLSTPAAGLKLMPKGFQLKMHVVGALAKIFRFWDVPSKRRATAYEEMSILDLFYWLYKCENPITRGEKGQRTADLFAVSQKEVGLPAGFVKQNSITMGAGGDLLYADSLDYSKDVLFEKVEDLLLDQTISFANFECPITEKAPDEPLDLEKAAPLSTCTRAQFDIIKGHKDKRFTILHTANNHTFDVGVDGVRDTLKAFSDEGIVDVGTNSAPDQMGKGRIIIKDGIKIGFASATFGLNGRTVPSGENYRVNAARLLSKHAKPDLELVKKQIDHCKIEGCDFIIASLHWGYEFEFFPRVQQVEASHALVEYGADAILCHHTHVIQPVEYYRTRRDPGRVAVIAYSLGSMAWTFAAPHLLLSMIVNLRLSKGLLSGKTLTYIEEASVTPVFRNYTLHNDKVMTQIEKLADHLGNNGDHSKNIALMKSYADLTLGRYNPATRNWENFSMTE